MTEPVGATSRTKTARVADTVRSMIHDGRLREGDALPSTRALAAELGVARGTVVTAFEQLDGEGYITVRHGAAARVAATLADPPARGRRASPRVQAPQVGAAQPVGPAGPASAAVVESVIDLVPGVPAVSAISGRDWRAAWRHAASLPLGDGYPDSLGDVGLRAEIAKQLAFSRGFAPATERVVISAGTSEAMSLVAEALGSGARVAVENPGYRSGRRALASAGARLIPIGLDEGGLRLDELRIAHNAEPLAAVAVTPSHQYPMGAVMPISRRRELLEWAAANGVLLIEDDYDSEFRHHGAPLPALAAIDVSGSVVHIGSFSKVLNPQLRTGYLVLPGDTTAAATLSAARVARGAAVATPVQHALAWFMSSGALRRHLARVRRDYSHKRSMLTDALADTAGLRVSALSGGLHAVVEWERGPDEASAVSRLRHRGVAVAALGDYVVDGSRLDTRGIVLGYGPVSATALARALAIIAAELTGPAPRTE
ncbi:PLP-dependent aminotransferase family protein [Gryllotalpicola reticulitermitis]|uniref:PLP-dependent aminotransferase family protein n=1 Tax=Gryllotalpicola reticulitermitis TaxID=1184153 RepID=A0ABV8Q1R1_9MICO